LSFFASDKVEEVEMAVDDACAGGEWTCVVDRKKASDASKIVNDLFIVRTVRLALRDAD